MLNRLKDFKLPKTDSIAKIMDRMEEVWGTLHKLNYGPRSSKRLRTLEACVNHLYWLSLRLDRLRYLEDTQSTNPK